MPPFFLLCFSGRSDVQVMYFQSVFLDELAAWFHIVTHQCGEDLICSNGIFHGYLHHPACFRIHGGFPQLLRVHLTQTLIALNIQATLGFLHQPVQSTLERQHYLFAFTTLDVGTVFNQAIQGFAKACDGLIGSRLEEIVAKYVLVGNTVHIQGNFRQIQATLFVTGYREHVLVPVLLSSSSPSPRRSTQRATCSCSLS